tara:strand:+ start:277 stop:1071 length:795 start_codon:yes stop_codon:yes gene_type:complete
MKSFNFCNNCGKTGHIFQCCSEPITSIGIIAYRNNNDIIEYLMICRKDTLGYLDFIRGRYNLYNIEYIKSIIDIMTIDEKNRILDNDFDYLWKNLWGESIGIQYRGEEKNAKLKFNQLKKGICINNNIINIKLLINDSNTVWLEPEWGFPKGRRNYQEKDIYCGLREFTEETGYDGSCINLIGNLIPYEEIFIGSNLKCYKHKYFVGNIENNKTPFYKYQDTEVSKVEWKSFDDCKKSIRNYNLEKLEIIQSVNDILFENNICI